MSRRRQDCPNAETIASFVEGGLDPETARAVAEHLADCDDCIELVRTVAALARENRPPRAAAGRARPHSSVHESNRSGRISGQAPGGLGSGERDRAG